MPDHGGRLRRAVRRAARRPRAAERRGRTRPQPRGRPSGGELRLRRRHRDHLPRPLRREPAGVAPPAQARGPAALLRGELLEPAGAREVRRPAGRQVGRARGVPDRHASVEAPPASVALGLRRARGDPVRHPPSPSARGADPRDPVDGVPPRARSGRARAVRNAVHLGEKAGRSTIAPAERQSRDARVAPREHFGRDSVPQRGVHPASARAGTSRLVRRLHPRDRGRGRLEHGRDRGGRARAGARRIRAFA